MRSGGGSGQRPLGPVQIVLRGEGAARGLLVDRPVDATDRPELDERCDPSIILPELTGCFRGYGRILVVPV